MQLCSGDVGVPLHRDLAPGRVAEQLLHDAGVGTGIDEQARRAMPQIVETHRRQARPVDEGLEMLGDPRAVDRQAVLGLEDERVAERHHGSLRILSIEMGPQPLNHEWRKWDGGRRGRRLGLDEGCRVARARDLVADGQGRVAEIKVGAHLINRIPESGQSSRGVA
jgi:hypothetical protein